jgi:hypothetical protein
LSCFLKKGYNRWNVRCAPMYLTCIYGRKIKVYS